MTGITINAKIDTTQFNTNLSRRVEQIKRQILRVDIPERLRKEQAKGFPKEPDQYTLILRNRRQEQRRQLRTIQAQYLRIGTERSPLRFTFIAGEQSIEKIAEAALFAYAMAFRRAPERTGHYLDTLNIWVGSIDSMRELNVRGGIIQALEANLQPNDSVFIRASSSYASTLEVGFYTKYYQTQSLPSGILYATAKATRRKHSADVAVRFLYVSGVKNGKAGYGTFPVVEIGPKDKFAQVDAKPGRKMREKIKANKKAKKK